MLLRDERGRTDKAVKETEVLLQKALKLQRETDDEARGWLSWGCCHMCVRGGNHVHPRCNYVYAGARRIGAGCRACAAEE